MQQLCHFRKWNRHLLRREANSVGRSWKTCPCGSEPTAATAEFQQRPTQGPLKGKRRAKGLLWSPFDLSIIHKMPSGRFTPSLPSTHHTTSIKTSK
mmetsp:Transcript_49306/g.56799  ORF Transcript_49306/g.56799 Transcript_49306/m.56799 type:complete len:96 (-) Transcript_49306:161-448(-)